MARMSRAVRRLWTEMRPNTDDRETVYVSVAAADPQQRRAGVDVDAGVLVARQRASSSSSREARPRSPADAAWKGKPPFQAGQAGS